jgi:purine nucleosidase
MPCSEYVLIAEFLGAIRVTLWHSTFHEERYLEMNWNRRCALLLLFGTLLTPMVSAQVKRKVIINQDCSGPGGSNLQTVLLMLQSPQVEVLGITVVSGDQWRDEEVAHTLRLLEIIGRTDVPVFAGAAFPLIRNYDETVLWQEHYGKVSYAGAWDPRWFHEPFVIPTLREGAPAVKASSEDAIHFILRMVHKYPHEVTIYEGGPMTNLALAIALDPQLPELAQELVFMGGSLNTATEHAEFVNNPRHEFNFWFDPEAAEVVLRAPWKKITCTPTDISIKTRLTPAMVKEIDSAGTPLAHYVATYFVPGPGSDFMWDELAAAAWIDPTIITKRETRYMGVDTDHGPGYGNTLTWTDRDKTKIPRQPVEIQVELDTAKLYRTFTDRLRAPIQPAVAKP